MGTTPRAVEGGGVDGGELIHGTFCEEQESPHMDRRSVLFEDCLKLLQGSRDEQRLAGLFLVPKFCKGDDHDSIRRVYDAIGTSFLDRLLRSALAKGSAGVDGANCDAYLQLSVTILAALSRVPEISSSEYMVSKIPLILELTSEPGSPILGECYEFLFLITSASGHGIKEFLNSEGMKVLACQLHALPCDSHVLELVIDLVQSIVSQLLQDSNAGDYIQEQSSIVSAMARQFALLQTPLKFKVLHLLSEMFLSIYSEQLREALSEVVGDWVNYMRVGIVNILHTLVALPEKLCALMLVESMVSMLGAKWLIGQSNMPELQDQAPADRCLLLVLESARVEIDVLLNEMAYLKYEAVSVSPDAVLLKQHTISILYSLIEKIIELMSEVDVEEGDLISKTTAIKVIGGINETMSVVLGYLQEAKEHNHNKGNDLLASLRVLGSYFAEIPNACNEQVSHILQYMLSIEGDDETSPFFGVCFLLPTLCQLALNGDAWKFLVQSHCYELVVDCLEKLITRGYNMVENNSCVCLACDTILYLLLMDENEQLKLEESTSFHLLKVFGFWLGEADGCPSSFIMVAASICALILDHASEESLLLHHPDFDNTCLTGIGQLLATALAHHTPTQDDSEMIKAERNLLEIVVSGYSRWAARFPTVKHVALHASRKEDMYHCTALRNHQ